MHNRLAARRDSIQTQRWAALALSVDHASAELERLLQDVDHAALRALVDRLTAVRGHLAEHSYTHEHLCEAVMMVSAVAVTLPRLVADAGFVSGHVGSGDAGAARDAPVFAVEDPGDGPP